MNILYIEDNKDDQFLIHEMMKKFSQCQYEILNGIEEFLVFYQEKKLKYIDLMVCDWMLPKTSGESIIFLAKEQNPNMYAILHTGFEDPVFQDKFSIFKVDKVLIKQPNFENLSSFIKNKYKI
jgi:DNA-binding NtrC family response regulator